MALTAHTPITQRLIFACAAADPRSPLSTTQRAAIWVSLQDHTWYPSQRTLPGTWQVVARWYEGLVGQKRQAITTLTQAEGA